MTVWHSNQLILLGYIKLDSLITRLYRWATTLIWEGKLDSNQHCTGFTDLTKIADESKERLTGFEPVIQPWQGRVLPLYYNRTPAFSGETVTHCVHCTLIGIEPTRPCSHRYSFHLELSGDIALLRTSYRYAAHGIEPLFPVCIRPVRKYPVLPTVFGQCSLI